jgi:hypothetical protein
VKLNTVLNHTLLNRQRCLDSVAGSRCGGLWLGAHHANTGISALLEPAAVFTDGGIPLNKVGKSNLVVVNNALAGSRVLNEVPLVAVRYHTVLDRRRRFYSIRRSSDSWAWLDGCGRRWGRTDNTDTCISILPEPATVFTNSRILLDKVGKGDLVIVKNTLITGYRRNIVELIAVGYHAFLDSVWGFDTIARRLLGSRGLLGNSGFDKGSRCLDARRHLGRSRNCTFRTNGGR